MQGQIAPLLAVALLVPVHLTWASVDAERSPLSSFAQLPVEFEVNQGQHDPAVRFLARARGYQMYLTRDGAVLTFDGSKTANPAERSSVQLRFVGADRKPELVAQEASEHKTNYLIGDQPSGFQTDIPNYARVLYRQLYPGIDVVFYGKSGSVEYDLLLQPGADPQQIAMEFDGAKRLEISDSGDLQIHTSGGILTQHRPQVFQERDGKREVIAASYQVVDGSKVKLQLSGFDSRRALTIDPVLSYSTYIGGFAAGGSSSLRGIAVDSAGNAYVVGVSTATDWPVASAYQSTRAGALDVVVAKINAQGTGLIYSTYIGGRNSNSSADVIAVDASGNAYIAGSNLQGNYPTTRNVFSTRDPGAFVTKLNPAGNGLVFSTYLKNLQGEPRGIALDGSGNVVVAGRTWGVIATTPGALKPTSSAPWQGFISKLNSTGSTLAYSTYFGGSGSTQINGLALDSSGNIYVTGKTSDADFPVTAGAFQGAKNGSGDDAFITKINSSGAAIVYSTYLGGSSSQEGSAIAVDASGRAFVTGNTDSVDFPIRNGQGKGINTTNYAVGFITVLNADGASQYWSTLFGGNACVSATPTSCTTYFVMDEGRAVAVDPSGINLYVAGRLSSLEGVNLQDPIQRDINGRSDAFVTYLQEDAFTPNKFNIRYATRLGGSAKDTANGLAIDKQGSAYVIGENDSGSGDFPTTKGAYRVSWTQGAETFVFKLNSNAAPITLTGACIGSNGSTAQLTASTALNASGNVIFKDGAATLATVPTTNGRASWTGALATGMHKFSASRDSDGATSQPIICKTEQ